MFSRSEGLFCPEAFDVIPGQTSMPIGGVMMDWKPAEPHVGPCTCNGGMHHPDTCEAILRAKKNKKPR